MEYVRVDPLPLAKSELIFLAEKNYHGTEPLQLVRVSIFFLFLFLFLFKFLAGGDIFLRSKLGIDGQVCPAQRTDRPRGGRMRAFTLWPYRCAL